MLHTNFPPHQDKTPQRRPYFVPHYIIISNRFDSSNSDQLLPNMSPSFDALSDHDYHDDDDDDDDEEEEELDIDFSGERHCCGRRENITDFYRSASAI